MLERNYVRIVPDRQAGSAQQLRWSDRKDYEDDCEHDYEHDYGDGNDADTARNDYCALLTGSKPPLVDPQLRLGAPVPDASARSPL